MSSRGDIRLTSRSQTAIQKLRNKEAIIGRCPLVILRTASCDVNHAARSASGYSWIRPDLGGHSMENRLLLKYARSKLPSTAQAEMIFPHGCLKLPSSIKSPLGLQPVSSSNSRRAAAKGFSPVSNSPFGMVQAQSSLLTQRVRPDEPKGVRGPIFAFGT